MKNLNFFSERVKQLRIDNNLSQPELGKAVNLSKQTINGLEHGRSKTTLDKVVIIADYFNVSIDYLVGRTDKPEINK